MYLRRKRETLATLVNIPSLCGSLARPFLASESRPRRSLCNPLFENLNSPCQKPSTPLVRGGVYFRLRVGNGALP